MPFLAAVEHVPPHVGLTAWIVAGLIVAEAAVRAVAFAVSLSAQDDPHDLQAAPARRHGLPDGPARSLLKAFWARGSALFCSLVPPEDPHRRAEDDARDAGDGVPAR